jgi:hypothetical protein
MTPSDQTQLETQLQRLHLHHIKSHYQAAATTAAEAVATSTRSAASPRTRRPTATGLSKPRRGVTRRGAINPPLRIPASAPRRIACTSMN